MSAISLIPPLTPSISSLGLTMNNHHISTRNKSRSHVTSTRLPVSAYAPFPSKSMATTSARRGLPHKQSRVNHAARRSNTISLPRPDSNQLDASFNVSSGIPLNLKFYPGLAAFTDSIDALPQETIRHFTLLREVDAKASGPEQLLRQYIRDALQLPKPQFPSGRDFALEHLRHWETVKRCGDEGLLIAEGAQLKLHDDGRDSTNTRRSRLQQVRMTISDLLLTLDEKIHVISTASEALTKHLTRIDDAYQLVSNELDAVVRDGNPEHWAYNLPVPKTTLAQRQAQQISEIASTDATNSRSETRREALARRNASHTASAIGTGYHHDNDDSSIEISTTSNHGTVVAPKRSHAVPRPRKDNDISTVSLTNAMASLPPSPALGATNLAGLPGHPTKKRKTVSAVTNTANTPLQASKGYVSPRATTPTLTQPTLGNGASSLRKRNNIAVGDSAGTARNTGSNVRKRNVAVPSSTPASLLAQASSKDALTAISTMHDASHPGINDSYQVSVNISSKPVLGRVGRPRPQLVAKSGSPNVRVNESQALALASNHDVGQDKSRQAEHDGKVSLEQANKQLHENPDKASAHGSSHRAHSAQPFTFEDTVHHSSIIALDNSAKRNNGSGNYQKQDVVMNQGPHALPSNKSIHLGTRMINTLIEGERVADDEADDEDDDGDPDDEADEMRYCYCNQVSYGKMVACDGPSCQKEWFHLPCVNLTHMPGPREKWYCNDCIGASAKPHRSHQTRI